MPMSDSNGFAVGAVTGPDELDSPPLLSFSGRVGSTFSLGAPAIQLTVGASSTCNGNACCCSSCCCW